MVELLVFPQYKVMVDNTFRDLRWLAYGRRSLCVCGEKDGTLGLNKGIDVSV